MKKFFFNCEKKKEKGGGLGEGPVFENSETEEPKSYEVFLWTAVAKVPTVKCSLNMTLNGQWIKAKTF